MNINLLPVTEAVITLFAVLLVGVAGRLTGVLKPKTITMMSELLVKITQPMLIIASLQIGFTKERLNTGLWLLLISGIVHILVTIFATIFYRKQPLRQKKVYIMATVFGNCAFMGFPILKALFPAEGLFYGAFYTFFFNVYIWTYGTYMLSRGSKQKFKPLKSLFNIGTISCGVSFLLFIMKIQLPTPILAAVDSIGNITFPLAMLIIGALIGGLGLKTLISGAGAYVYSFLKLLVIPVITLLVCVVFKIDKGLTLLLMAMTAVPSAANNAIFAELYDADASLSAKLIGMSTLFSLMTIPLILQLSSWVLNIL